MERTFRLRRGYIGDPYTRSTAMIPVAKIGPTLIRAHPTINCVVTILPPLTKNETLVCLFEGEHQCDRPRPTKVALTVCDRRCYCYKCSGRNEVFAGPLTELSIEFPYCSNEYSPYCQCRLYDCLCPLFLRLRIIDRQDQEIDRHMITFVEKCAQ